MIIIESYEIIKDSVQSKFKISINNNNYFLIIPLNPLIDVDILKLHKVDEKESLIIIKNIIKNKLYSKETLEKLILFKNWIYNNCLNFSQLSL
jgi:hypothetical protein